MSDMSVASTATGFSWCYETGGEGREAETVGPRILSPEMKVGCQIEIPAGFPIAVGELKSPQLSIWALR